ncbi:MAG: hypothetical protein ACK5TH_25435, partial [Prosthecobacter sp.]
GRKCQEWSSSFFAEQVFYRQKRWFFQQFYLRQEFCFATGFCSHGVVYPAVVARSNIFVDSCSNTRAKRLLEFSMSTTDLCTDKTGLKSSPQPEALLPRSSCPQNAGIASRDAAAGTMRFPSHQAPNTA